MSKKIIRISVKDRYALTEGNPVIICGNSGYSVEFTFDPEWDEYEVKTARFVYVKRGKVKHQDVVFAGTTAVVPILSNIQAVHVGVFAADLSTTTPARIPCRFSVRCGTGAPEDPTPSQYDQIMALLRLSDPKKLVRLNQGTENAGRALVVGEDGVVRPQTDIEDIYKAQTAADNAQTAADNAQTAADNAQTAADNAQTAAGNAQTAAGNAQTAADNAQTAADDAQDTADNAVSLANNAQATADNAIPAPATASVGQAIKVSAVDENGKPTAWEAVDFPKDTWRLVKEVRLTEDSATIDITQDTAGNAFALKEYLLIGFVVGAAENTKAGSLYVRSLSDRNNNFPIAYAAQSVPLSGGKKTISFYGKVCGKRMRVIFGNSGDGSSETNAQMYTMIDNASVTFPGREVSAVRTIMLSTNVAGYGAGTILELWGIDA